jgi:EmrB/QacA subfamily drug resistance transporter
MGAVFLAAMESTVVATAMPTVIASLGGLRIYSWTFSAFLLASTVTMPLWGRLADERGRRLAYLAGLGFFVAGSALSGLSQSMAELIAYRTIQGVGAGSLISVGMTIIGDLYELDERAKMQGYFSGVWGVASLLGPLIGGFLTDHVSWRWVFYINVPLGVLASVAIARGLPAAGPRGRRAPFDYLGTALFGGSVSALLIALVEGGRGASWARGPVLGLLVFSGGLLGAFVAVERRARAPVIPLGLFRNPMVRAASATGFLSGMAMFGAIAYVPLFLQAVLGSTATQAGFVLTPFVLGWVTFSILGARLVLRVGYRAVVISGMCVLTAAFVLLTAWNQSLTRLAAGRDILVAGVGMGLIFVPMLIAVQNAVPRAMLGSATSMTGFFRTVGGAVGVSVMGSIMAHRLQTGLAGLIERTPGPLHESVHRLVAQPDLMVSPLTRTGIPPEALLPVRAAMAQALSGVFLVGLAVAVIALASAFLVPPGQARELATPRGPGGVPGQP